MNSRHGGGFIRFLVVIVLVAAVLVVGWGVFANWRASGEVSAHVLDPDWWTVSRDEARPMIDDVRDWTIARKEEVWGDGGLIDQGDAWLEQWGEDGGEQSDPARNDADERDAATDPVTGHRKASNPNRRPGEATTTDHDTTGAPPPAPRADPAADATSGADTDAAPAENTTETGTGTGTEAETGTGTAPTTPTPSPATARLLERIRAAEEHFALGNEAMKAADPAQGWTDTRADAYRRACEHFRQVRRILVEEGVAEDYAAMDDADPAVVRKTEELVALNQRLLYSASKSASP